MNENQLQALLKLAADRLQTTPEKLRAAAERGDLQDITGSDTTNPQAQQLRRVLSDPEAAKKLLSCPKKIAIGKQKSSAAGAIPAIAELYML